MPLPALRDYRLQALTWQTVRQMVPTRIDTAILPVGTVEAHGAACIGTDNIIPESIATVLAPRLNALIAPIVSHGVTRSLYAYAGSTMIQPDTFKRYILDILLSLSHTGFRNVIILNGHGGNNGVLKEAAMEANHQFRINVAALHWWELCAEVTSGFWGESGAHAGVDETAMVMAVNPAYATPDEYSPDMLYTFTKGADVYPVPGTILSAVSGQGAPQFDLARAKEYHALVCGKVGDFAEFVLARWRAAGFA